MEIITLKLNEQESILIKEIDIVCACENLYIEYVGENKTLVIYDNMAQLFFDRVNELFLACLQNKAQLHESIDQDIGFIFNEYLQDRVKGVKDPGVHWVGFQSYLGGKTDTNSDGGDTWLYNDEHGNIILKMTPTYTWSTREPEPGEDFIEYEEWIKSYKPMLIRIIPHEVLQRWYEQIKQLEQHVQENERKAREQASLGD